jgi:cell division topological specificity factor
MNLFRFLTPVKSAPVARKRLGVLLEYDRHVVKQADLVAILREELASVLGRHIAFDPQKVRMKQIRGNAVCSVVVDIGAPNRMSVIAMAATLPPCGMSANPAL